MKLGNRRRPEERRVRIPRDPEEIGMTVISVRLSERMFSSLSRQKENNDAMWNCRLTLLAWLDSGCLTRPHRVKSLAIRDPRILVSESGKLTASEYHPPGRSHDFSYPIAFHSRRRSLQLHQRHFGPCCALQYAPRLLAAQTYPITGETDDEKSLDGTRALSLFQARPEQNTYHLT